MTGNALTELAIEFSIARDEPERVGELSNLLYEYGTKLWELEKEIDKLKEKWDEENKKR